MNGTDGKDGDEGLVGRPGEMVSYAGLCRCSYFYIMYTIRVIKVHLEYLAT